MPATMKHPNPAKKKITLKEFNALALAKGAHASRANGLCALEAAAWLAGRDHNDHPPCVSPVIAAFCRRWNDDLDDEARNQLLKPLIPKMLDTAGDAKLEDRRAWMVLDWTVRTYTPAFLRLIKLSAEATALAELPEIVDVDSLDAAVKVLAPARDKAAAARDAARAAAGDAARAAAGDAAKANRLRVTGERGCAHRTHDRSCVSS